MITRLAGLLLLLLFVAYSLFLYRTDRTAFNRREQLETLDDDGDDDQKPRDQANGRIEHASNVHWCKAVLPLLGLAAMAAGGPTMVEGALRLAQSAGAEQGVVGATIVALGTGAEIIALAVSAARKRQSEVLVGAILGSFAYNLLVTLGLAAVIRPLPVETHLTSRRRCLPW